MRELNRFINRTFGSPAYTEIRKELLEVGRKHFEAGAIPESLGIEAAQEPVYHHPDFTFYPERSQVQVGDQTRNLSPLEKQLLWVLAQRSNRIVPNRTLCVAVLGYEDGIGSLRHHTMNLRRKLTMEDGAPSEAIESVRGVGLRLVDKSKTDEVFGEMPSQEEERIYRHSAFTHYPERQIVVIDDQEIPLTYNENRLLALLGINKNHVVTKFAIFGTIHVRALNSLLLSLRRKVEPGRKSDNYQYLLTTGVGLKLVDPTPPDLG